MRQVRETLDIDTATSGHREPGFGPVADLLRTQLTSGPVDGASVGGEARAGEKWEIPPEMAEGLAEEQELITEIRHLDLTAPAVHIAALVAQERTCT